MYKSNGFIAVKKPLKLIGSLLFYIVVGYKAWLECFYASKHITTITHRQLCNTLSIRFLSFLNAFKQVLEASLRKMNLYCFKLFHSYYVTHTFNFNKETNLFYLFRMIVILVNYKDNVQMIENSNISSLVICGY